MNFFDSLGFSPNGITILGFVITAGAGILIACQYFLIGGLLMLGGGALDLIDGGLARRKGKASKKAWCCLLCYITFLQVVVL